MILNYNNKNIEFVPTVDIHNQLWNIFKENTFVFLKKEVYNTFPKEISKEISNMTLPEFTGPDQTKDINDILKMKIVFVFFKQKEDINTIKTLRKIFTKDESIAILDL